MSLRADAVVLVLDGEGRRQRRDDVGRSRQRLRQHEADRVEERELGRGERPPPGVLRDLADVAAQQVRAPDERERLAERRRDRFLDLRLLEADPQLAAEELRHEPRLRRPEPSVELADERTPRDRPFRGREPREQGLGLDQGEAARRAPGKELAREIAGVAVGDVALAQRRAGRAGDRHEGIEDDRRPDLRRARVVAREADAREEPRRDRQRLVVEAAQVLDQDGALLETLRRRADRVRRLRPPVKRRGAGHGDHPSSRTWRPPCYETLP